MEGLDAAGFNSKQEKTEKQEYKDSWLADEEKGRFLVEQVRKAVFDEYDRALLEGTSSKEPADHPVKKNDHALDALRYVIYTVERPRRKGHVLAA